jgi:xanthine dehydrogenase accessory factor
VYRLLERITAREGAPPDTRRLYAPVGLNLGALSPAELAVSIVAELVALRHGVASLEHLRAVEHAPSRRRMESALRTADEASLARPLAVSGQAQRARGSALDEVEEGDA